MNARCRRGCGAKVPLFGVTCAVCTRLDLERTPRTEAGKAALRRTMERRVADEADRRERFAAGLARTRAAAAAAAAARTDDQLALL